MTDLMMQAVEETFLDVQDAALRIIRSFGVPEDDARDEVADAFMDTYPNYRPERGSFRNYVLPHAYGRARGYFRRKKKEKRYHLPNNAQVFSVLEMGLFDAGGIPDDSPLYDHVDMMIDDPDARLWRMISGLPDDTAYVITYCLNPPKRIAKIVSTMVDVEKDPIRGRMMWRRVLKTHLIGGKKWTKHRVYQAFASAEEAMTRYTKQGV